VGVVDARDDSIRRFIVRHYRYDPERRERRHVVVAAFDSHTEMEACLRAVDAQIAARRAAGEPVDAKEHASGTTREAGDDRLAANGRMVSRALGHGVRPGPWLEQIELPRNMWVMWGKVPRPGWGGRLRRLIPRLLRGRGRP
jgi:hypothetical protein